MVDLHYRVPAQPYRAHDVFVVVQKGLGKGLYDRYCQVFLAECKRLAEELGYQQSVTFSTYIDLTLTCPRSDLYNAFSQELRELSMQLLPEQQNLSSAEEEHAENTQGNADLGYSDTSGGGRSTASKAPASRRMSKASRRSHPYFRQHTKKSAPESSSAATHFGWNEAEILREAACDTLLYRASELYTQFSAFEYREAAHERVNVEDITARIRKRLEVLRLEFRTRPNHANQPNQAHVMDQSFSSPLALRPAPAPIIGGACDFSTPSHQPSPFANNVQVLSSDMGTHPSSQEYQTGYTSPGFLSFAASSQTSFNFDNSTYIDPSQFAGAQFATDYVPAPHTHDQWFSSYDVNLDVPSSSRLPQQLLAEQNANAQMFPELDRIMASSPSKSPYALSHAPEDDLTWLEATIE
jgi:hypothetical protein